MRHFVRLGLGTVMFMAAAGAAMAMETCSGELSASSLRPLPVPAVVGIDLTDNSPENAGLANAFTRGMSDAGAQVPGSATATVKLRLSWQVLGASGGGPSGQSSGDGSAPPFVQGGIDREPPAVTTNQLLRGRVGTAQPGLLVFRAEARDPAGATIYWIGSVQCTLHGGEDERLLYQLGQVIGGSIGQRRDHVGM